MSILDLFCSVDEFWQQFAPWWQQHLLASGARQRRRPTRLHPSEIMTIAILFQQSHYRTFKAFYTEHVQQHLRGEFLQLVSYTRFVELLPTVLVPLIVYLYHQLGTCTGISFIDSTALAVCKTPRIHQHRVFACDAARGKTSVGWFYGFKLHLVVDDRGELLAFCLTPGNVDDRRPVPRLVRRLFGKLFGDRGYISQDLAADLLVTQGLHLITKLRKNMHNRLVDVGDRLLLRKRALIETIVDELKNVCQIEHSRHRSPLNFLVNLMAGLIAYCHLPKKPSLDLGLPALPAAA
ncbi:MAG TPA: IS982 family transposase [Ktedonobacterales bacterium]|nr:IS982 family transposase [Ktedonobacterales bacterium]